MENYIVYLLVLVIVLAIIYLYVLKGKTNVKKVAEGFEGGGFVLGNEEIEIEASKPSVGGGVPSGTIMAYYTKELENQKLTSFVISTLNGKLQPQGWAVCDGQNGTPDLRGRFILSADSKHSFGKTGGEEEHKLTIDEIPIHDHTSNGSYCKGGNCPRYGGDGYSNNGKTSKTGGDKPHNNMPPYIALIYIMKL